MTADLDRTRDAQNVINPADRDTWIRMAMSVKAELGDAGFDIWDDWAQQADSHNDRDARAVWRGIKANGKVTAGTLFHEAKSRGWKPNGAYQAPTPAEIAERKRVAAERAVAEEAKRDADHAAAAVKAVALWKVARAAGADHPYLLRKGVTPVLTLREVDAAAAAILGYAPKSSDEPLTARLLLVPVKIADAISTLELIDGDGRKSAIAGGAKAGGYWAAQPLPAGDDARQTLLIGEGCATMLSARAATGHPVVAALSCGNLQAVARTMRQRYPAATIVICADLGNGQAAAEQAALAVDGKVAIPVFGADRGDRDTDFNDLHQAQGLDAVKQAIADAAAPDVSAQLPGAASSPEGDPSGYDVALIRGDTIEPEAIRWVWSGWLAAGKFHVLAGAAGVGKSTIALALAATITCGGGWPDRTRAEPGNVLIWSGEDDPADTLVPRLLAMGAAMDRVHFVGDVREGVDLVSFDPARHMPGLEQRAAALDVKLVIVDPVVSAVAGDSHKNAEVRRSLQPLVSLAVRLDCAVLGITHFTKGTAGRDPTERVTGSLAFAALARIVLVAAKLPEEDGGNPGRILARSKSNIGIDTGGFGYNTELTELDAWPGLVASRVLWGAAIDGTARELLAEAEQQDDGERSATDEAQEWLTELLVPGSMKAADVQREAKQAGISERALRRAREKLGIKPHKDGFANGWRWALHRAEDAPPTPEDAEDAPIKLLGAFDDGGRLRADDDYTEVEF